LAADLSTADGRLRQQHLCGGITQPTDHWSPRRTARVRGVQRLPALSARLCLRRRSSQHFSGLAGFTHNGILWARNISSHAHDGRCRTGRLGASMAAAWRVARRQFSPVSCHLPACPRIAATRRARVAWFIGGVPSMTAASGESLCSHCLLPIGRRALEQTVNGERCTFCCYGCSIAFQVRHGKTEEWEAAWLLIRLGVGGFLSMNIMLFSLLIYGGVFTGADARLLPYIDILLLALATPAVVVLGGPFLRETLAEGANGRLAPSALIVLGVGAAYAYSTIAVIEKDAQVYFDTATMVLMLFTVGRYLEAAGRARAGGDLEPLLAADREHVVVVEDGFETSRPMREIEAGMTVRVRPGERIAVDGVIIEGVSHADEAVITGESQPVEKGPGSAVIAGSINMEGLLLIRSSGSGTDTRWAQICRSVREALMHRSPILRLADRAVAAAVPGVSILAALTVAYWAQWLPLDRAMLMGVAVLVVACPCAVGLAAPLATSLGIGRLARHGCLVRDASTLEELARVRLLAFDKTGTLTLGKARIVAIESDGIATTEVLAIAAGLERHSEHGLGRAVVRAAADLGIETIA